MTLESLKLFSVLLVIFFTSYITEAQVQEEDFRIDEILDSANAWSDAPHWDAETKSLYYVDINSGTILRYSYAEKKVYRAKVRGEEFASFIIPVAEMKNQFAIGCGRAVKLIEWDGYSNETKSSFTLFEFNKKDYGVNSGIRFNDGKCDSQGRLFTGTMNYTDPFNNRSYGLYSHERYGLPKVALQNVRIPNGFAWNDDTKKFYFSDTAAFNIREYNYSIANGTIDGQTAKIVLDLHKSKVQPHGMTIDTEGNIYVATFNSLIYKLDPRAEHPSLAVKMPCKYITSVAFGGPNLSSLFVTTADIDNEPNKCGYLYEVRGLKAKGHPMNKIQVH